MGKSKPTVRALSRKNEAHDEVRALYAEMYWRRLEVERIEKEISTLEKRCNSRIKKYGLKVPSFKNWMAACESSVSKKLSVIDMVRVLLWERWHDGMTRQEIVRDINLRWGRHRKIKTETIDKALVRLQKAEKGYFTAGEVEFHDSVYSHWDQPNTFWPDKQFYRALKTPLQGKQ